MEIQAQTITPANVQRSARPRRLIDFFDIEFWQL
jgi:hypothetical protein